MFQFPKKLALADDISSLTLADVSQTEFVPLHFIFFLKNHIMLEKTHHVDPIALTSRVVHLTFLAVFRF